MANDWEVSRSTGRCALTEKPFAEGDSYYAVLYETPQGFERRDVSTEAWTGPPADCFCYWRAKMVSKPKRTGIVAVDHALLTQFFLRLEESPDVLRQQFRFVLALLLMRKRHLRFERAVREDEQEYWQLRLVADQSQHRVLNPRLTPEEVEQLSAQLSAILGGDVEAIDALERDPEAAPAEPAEAPRASEPEATTEGRATPAD